MKHLFIWSFVFGIGCVDAIKQMLAEPEEDEEDEDEDDSERYEGDKQGDCLDGIDNDEDGYIDCEDQGCDGKPACQNDTGIVDTGDTSDTDTDTDTEVDPLDIDDDRDGYTENEGDCDDTDPYTHPGAWEQPDDGVDQDCDGEDEISPENIDDDGDGFTENQGDCNDNNHFVYPGAYDAPEDGIDQDCDGADAVDPFTTDDDGDGFTENDGDCDDTDPSAYPLAIEIPNDGTDQNCNGIDSECCYILELESSYNGWHGGTLARRTNWAISSAVLYTLPEPETYAEEYFCVNYVDSMQLYYNEGDYNGQFDSWNSFTISSDSGNQLHWQYSLSEPGLQFNFTCNW